MSLLFALHSKIGWVPDTRALRIKADAAQASGNLRHAVRRYRKLVQHGDRSSRFPLGICLQQLRAYRQAMIEFETVLIDHPSHVDCIERIAFCAEKLGDRDKATALYREASARSADHRRRLSSALTRVDHDYRKLVADADRLRDGGHFEAAAERYSFALRRNPYDIDILIQYGHTAKESHWLFEALNAYRMAAELDVDRTTDVALHLADLERRLVGRRTAKSEAMPPELAAPLSRERIAAIMKLTLGAKPQTDFALRQHFSGSLNAGELLLNVVRSPDFRDRNAGLISHYKKRFAPAED
ncbi:tetratricopeptide repeat protein [Lichenihabitans psoromatis]|uniref:tetratricopeptide repeat protein n=1 Tax=Lichenihabitans psoromatis TaxID=2528642 RepID=UPI00103580D0|nr:hypothetical protein [Lichenihabitans psoromatis]